MKNKFVLNYIFDGALLGLILATLLAMSFR